MAQHRVEVSTAPAQRCVNREPYVFELRARRRHRLREAARGRSAGQGAGDAAQLRHRLLVVQRLLRLRDDRHGAVLPPRKSTTPARRIPPPSRPHGPPSRSRLRSPGTAALPVPRTTITLLNPAGHQVARNASREDDSCTLHTDRRGRLVLIGSTPGHHPQVATLTVSDPTGAGLPDGRVAVARLHAHGQSARPPPGRRARRRLRRRDPRLLDTAGNVVARRTKERGRKPRLLRPLQPAVNRDRQRLPAVDHPDRPDRRSAGPRHPPGPQGGAGAARVGTAVPLGAPKILLSPSRRVQLRVLLVAEVLLRDRDFVDVSGGQKDQVEVVAGAVGEMHRAALGTGDPGLVRDVPVLQVVDQHR
jgi:hypothetical protein